MTNGTGINFTEKLLSVLNQFIEEGLKVKRIQFIGYNSKPKIEDLIMFKSWVLKSNTFIKSIGLQNKQDFLLEEYKPINTESFTNYKEMYTKTWGENLAKLKALKDFIEKGGIFHVQEAIYSSYSDGLYDLAKKLFKENAFRASVIIGRVVAEQTMRQLLRIHEISFDPKKDTGGILLIHLKREKLVSNSEGALIESILKLGNDAIHNDYIPSKKETQKFLTNIKEELLERIDDKWYR